MSRLALVSRAVVGVVWVAAGLLKLPDPTENVRAVRAYQLLPESLVPVIGHGLPVLELVVGMCLLVGLVVRPMAVLSAALLVAFIVGISAAWARGLSIECGCFGGGGGPSVGASDKYPWELARDVGLLLASVLLVWRPRMSFTLDQRLFRTIDPVTAAGSTSSVRTRRAQRTQAA